MHHTTVKPLMTLAYKTSPCKPVLGLAVLLLAVHRSD